MWWVSREWAIYKKPIDNALDDVRAVTTSPLKRVKQEEAVKKSRETEAAPMTDRQDLYSARWDTPSEARQLVAVSVDSALAIVGGLVTGMAVSIETTVDGVLLLQLDSPTVWWSALCGGIAMSFCNHVLITLATRSSIGKATAGLRVVREADGGPPGFSRLCGRWLYGFGWTIVAVPIHMAADSNVKQEDAVGLRIVRRTFRA